MERTENRSVPWRPGLGGILPCLLALLVAGCAEPDVDREDAGDASADSPSGPPGAVVLLVVDTLRADATSMTGHHKKTTPQTDRLAEQGVVFTAAYAPSAWTVPSMASLHTSVYPTSHGIVNGAIGHNADHEVVRQQVLDGSFVTLAEAFQAGGYTTVGVAANRHLAAKLGFGQGFDVYFDEAWFGDARWLNQIAGHHLTRALGPSWSEDFAEEPAFLWLHYFDPHLPYTPRLPWIRAFADDYVEHPGFYPAHLTDPDLRRIYHSPGAAYRECALPLYEAEVAYWDDRFRRLSRELGVDRRDVLLVFTSDHGEEFGEHGGLAHGRSLYEELVRVPLVFYWPRGIPGGRTIDEPVSILDVFPTLVELAGLEPPPGLQGRSLAPLLRGEGTGPEPERELLFELHPPRPALRAIRSGNWKLVEEQRTDGRVELYDLETDPGELNDLAGERPDVAQHLRQRLGEAFADLPPEIAAGSIDVLDPELREQLEQLGYLGGYTGPEETLDDPE